MGLLDTKMPCNFHSFLGALTLGTLPIKTQTLCSEESKPQKKPHVSDITDHPALLLAGSQGRQLSGA